MVNAVQQIMDKIATANKMASMDGIFLEKTLTGKHVLQICPSFRHQFWDWNLMAAICDLEIQCINAPQHSGTSICLSRTVIGA